MAIISINRFLAFVLALTVLCSPVLACTSFIITPGASTDGSMYVGHTNDGFGSSVVGHTVANESTQMIYVPAADHPEGAMRAVNYDPNSGSDDDTKYLIYIGSTIMLHELQELITNTNSRVIGQVLKNKTNTPNLSAEFRLF